mmetsp:Transcript_118601/g.342987  ORF Transcript_118601/g.342987 Transcript_118601/m.342987 type:complete len:439 (+) Transcript_118601:3917-5233(+)
MDALASFSATPVFSMASLSASIETLSKSSADKISAALFTASTFFSVSVTLSTTSARRAAIFRSAVSLLKVSSFFTDVSKRDICAVSSSVTLAESSLTNFFASLRLALMKPRAALMARSALADADSESLIALPDSSAGKISMPFKKGISASWHATNACAAASTLSPAFFSMPCTDKLSRWRRSVVTTASKLFRMPLTLSNICVSSSFMAPSAPRDFDSTRDCALSMQSFAGATTFSAPAISSSESWPCSAEETIIEAFSTSSSALPSSCATSASCFLASTRFRNSFLNVLYGVSFRCASVIFCCNVENSEMASFRVSGAYFRAAWSFVLMSFLASVIFSWASPAALSISSMACLRRSPDSSGGSAISGAAKDMTASTASMERLTTSCIAGSVSSSALPSFSSCAFVAAAVSAAFFALDCVAWALEISPRKFWFCSASCC